MSQTGLTNYKLSFKVKKQKKNQGSEEQETIREEWIILSDLNTPFDNSEQTHAESTYSGGARSRNLGGAFEGQTHIFGGGQDIIFKKVLLYRTRETNILGISPPPQRGECPRNIAPPPPL